MRAIVIINPAAGPRRTRILDSSAATALVERVLTARGYHARTVFTSGKRDAARLAREAIDADATLVIAWGGDGTISQVGGELCGTAASLGIVPRGSGNGLARALGVSLDPEVALRQAVEGRDRMLDVGDVAGHRFVNVAGVGLDAAVAHRFAAVAAGGRGLAGYVLAAWREGRRFRAWDVRVEAAPGRVEASVLAVVIANAPQYGNGATIAPAAIPDDGALDLVLVGSKGFVSNLWRSRRLFDGSLARDPDVRFLSTTSATIVCGCEMPLHCDGEPLPPRRAFDVTILPRSLRVRVPSR